jgi:CoA:oxalate CoA-transferase
MTTSSAGPLAGYRILEVCHMLAGPYAGMLLADLGAEVIKIETGLGDIARSTGTREVDGHNLYFASLNRNKKSVALDLTSPQDRLSFDALVASSHGLITNLRPRAIRKLGLTYEALRSNNPKLACMAITGFGLEGPYSEFPAYDYIIQAMTGVMLLTGEPDAPPQRAGYSVVDNSGGMLAAVGLLAKIIEGKGGQAEVALYDCILSQLNYLASAYLNGGDEPQRYAAGGHSFFVPAQIFESADGYISLFITHDGFWNIFAENLGRTDWLTDERFARMQARYRNRDIVVASIADELRKRTSADWVARLQPLGLVIAGVSNLAAALDGEGIVARDMLATITTIEGPLRLVGNPIKVAGFAQSYVAPPRLGQHTGELCHSGELCHTNEMGSRQP